MGQLAMYSAEPDTLADAAVKLGESRGHDLTQHDVRMAFADMPGLIEAAADGNELTDQELDAMAGGVFWDLFIAPALEVTKNVLRSGMSAVHHEISKDPNLRAILDPFGVFETAPVRV